MNRIAKFEKVSLTRFTEDLLRLMPETAQEEAENIYNGIILPQRATSGSAGYDFRTPVDITLLPMQTVTIPTGIRAFIEDGWFLMCCPRSGLGFKYRLRLDNTVGIIDSDYYGAPNEGHIMIKITNESNESKTLTLNSGDAFAQGIFIPYGITLDDSASEKRIGGFGSSSVSLHPTR